MTAVDFVPNRQYYPESLVIYSLTGGCRDTILYRLAFSPIITEYVAIFQFSLVWWHYIIVMYDITWFVSLSRGFVNEIFYFQ